MIVSSVTVGSVMVSSAMLMIVSLPRDLNEKGRSGGVPVQPLLNLYLKNTKLKTVNVPSF
jgi:hypothetical protein